MHFVPGDLVLPKGRKVWSRRPGSSHPVEPSGTFLNKGFPTEKVLSSSALLYTITTNPIANLCLSQHQTHQSSKLLLETVTFSLPNYNEHPFPPPAPCSNPHSPMRPPNTHSSHLHQHSNPPQCIKPLAALTTRC